MEKDVVIYSGVCRGSLRISQNKEHMHCDDAGDCSETR